MIRDISIALREGTPEWPGDTPYACRWASLIANGESVNVSAVIGSPHVGTHADAPVHVHDGWPGSHELPLDAFIGRAAVIDVTAVEGVIEAETLEYDPAAHGERLLLRTGRTIAAGQFPADWPTLSEACVKTLLGRGLRLLGVDAPSVDPRESKTLPVHHMLFSANAYILENLDLRRVPVGTYELIALPLKLMALDAAPVRAVLRDTTG
ncbi:MAG TPA: cyclase family protein [Gemmatimonadaceae bacterium]|nr:cyclase family protein [Gemmatimonadaceae bacterium]